MFRNICIRVIFGAMVAALAVVVSPTASQTATADELKVVPLTGSEADTLQRGDGGLVRFLRGITLKAGPGHRSGPVKLGLWKASGAGNGYRIEFTPHHGIPGNGNVPDMNREDSRCVKDIVARYKTAPRLTAAATAYVILNRQNEAPWRKYRHWAIRHHKFSKKLQRRAERINRNCKHHSPFTAEMRTELVYFGQTGSGSTTVLAAHGLSAPSGLNVQTSGSGARIFDEARHTNGRGIARFNYRLSGVDGGSASATVTGPDATRADLLVTPDGNTRLLVNSYKTTTTTSSKLRQKVLEKPKVSFKNPYASDGTGTVRVKAKVPAKAGHRVRFTARNGGKNHRWTIRPGHKGSTKFKAADASQVRLSYCYVKRAKGKCISKVHEYGHTTEVVTPAWPTWTEQTSGNTPDGAKVTLSLFASPSTPRFDRAWIFVNGKAVQSVNLSKTTGSVAKTIRLKKGRIQVKFQAYRNSDFTGALLDEPKVIYDRTFN